MANHTPIFCLAVAGGARAHWARQKRGKEFDFGSEQQVLAHGLSPGLSEWLTVVYCCPSCGVGTQRCVGRTLFWGRMVSEHSLSKVLPVPAANPIPSFLHLPAL